MTRENKIRETLDVIRDVEDRGLSLSNLVELVDFDTSTSTISRLVNKANDRNLLIIKKDDGNPNVYQVTSLGERFIEQRDPYQEEPGRSDAGEVRIHYIRGQLQIQNIKSIDDKWKEESIKKEMVPHYEEGGPFEIRYRVTGDKLIIYLLKDVEGYNVVSLKSEIMYQFIKSLEYLQQFTPYRFKKKRCLRIKTSTQHIALVRDPFAEFVDRNSDVKLSDIKINDENSELRFWMDKSDGKPELEAGWGNNPGGLKYWSESDIFFIKKYVYEFLINNKRLWKKFLRFLKNADLDELEEDYRKEDKNKSI